MGRPRGRPRAVTSHTRGRGRGRGRIVTRHQRHTSSDDEIDERHAEEVEILAMESGLNDGEITSGNIERIFSTANEISSGKRNRTKCDLLENFVFINRNRHVLK